MMRIRVAVSLALVAASAAAAPAQASSTANRYSLVHGCYALRSLASGQYVAKSGGGYRATATVVGAAEPFRMQATALGRYLLYGRARDFMTGDGEGGLAPASHPSEQADWRVDEAGAGVFRITLPAAGKTLAGDKGGGLVLGSGQDERFRFEPASGCPTYPEAAVDAVGRPSKRKPGYGEVRGLLDMHVHLMFFEAFGGEFHCGRPWHPYGVEYALPDCASIQGYRGSAAPVQNFVDYGSPVAPHDTRGWPSFHDWPGHSRLSYEGIYYRWLERAWLAGLRLLVPLHADNQVLCELMARRTHGCNEMASMRRQIRDVYELQDYIDAQSGGPGKGWFRVVTDPFQARRVINRGKLAVVQGIETSELFDCGLRYDVPQCDRAQIDRGLNEVYRLGVRQMELIVKFDNAFGGVAGDAGTTGLVVNTGNFIQTGRWWAMQTCTGPASDNPQSVHTDIGLALQAALAPGSVPAYPPPPHCNARGLSPLGEYLISRMIAKGMIFDPDHMSAVARRDALALVGANRYSGVISSHSWSDEVSYPEIYKLGGVVTPYAGGSKGFVDTWRKRRRESSRPYYFGFGYGSDMHGLAAQGGPRSGPSPVRYPYKSFDGKVTLDRLRAGERVWDVNRDGVANYGIYPDWLADGRELGGQQFVRDMSRGPEAYLQTWERAVGIPGPRCRMGRAHFKRSGVGRLRLGVGPAQLLRRAGQPRSRFRAWRYCVRSRRGRPGGSVAVVFTRRPKVGLVMSSARAHEAAGIAPGMRTRRLRGRALRIGRGLWVRQAGRRARFVYVVRRGRVRQIGVASRSVAKNRKRLRRYVRIGEVK